MPFFKKHKTVMLLSLVLIAVSAAVVIIQLVLFHRPEETEFLLLQDLTFLPISVLLVTLILEKFLSSKDKRQRMEKIHIVVSEFFSEAGVAIISMMNAMAKNLDWIRETLSISPGWKEQDFRTAAKAISREKLEAAATPSQLADMHMLLSGKKRIILAMFENPNLLEHDKITDMLWAVYHVADELQNREELTTLPQSDLNHLAGDVQRAYRLLILEWIEYMRHLKGHYPYLFFLALRKNPFTHSDVIVRN